MIDRLLVDHGAERRDVVGKLGLPRFRADQMEEALNRMTQGYRRLTDPRVLGMQPARLTVITTRTPAPTELPAAFEHTALKSLLAQGAQDGHVGMSQVRDALSAAEVTTAEVLALLDHLLAGPPFAGPVPLADLRAASSHASPDVPGGPAV